VSFHAHLRHLLIAACVATSCVAIAPADGPAQTFEQIREACREAVGPQMRSCVQSKIGMDKDAARAACKDSLSSTVRACVSRETQKAAGNKPPPPTPKADAGPAPASGSAPAVARAFVPPPRTIADVTAVLDGEKPDAAKIAKLTAAADATPPGGLSAGKLAQFHYDRGNARAVLGRTRDALADALKALEVASGQVDAFQWGRLRQFAAIQHQAAGNNREAIKVAQGIVSDGLKGGALNASRFIAGLYAAMGDISQADAYARRVASLVTEARGSPHPSWRSTYPIYGKSWEADAAEARAQIFELRGQYKEAAAEYERSMAFRRASLPELPKMHFPPPPEQVLLVADRLQLSIAKTKARQGALAQAEADARKALLAVLKRQGKYNPQTTPFIVGLAEILIEQGRYAEAEKLVRSALDVRETLAMADGTPDSARIIRQLGTVLVLQGRAQDAEPVYKRLEAAVSGWDRSARDAFMLNESRISALYAAGQVKAGVTDAEELLKRERARVGERHIDTASARATVALGYALAGRDVEAIREFKASVPVLLAAGNESASEDDATLVAARRQRLQSIVESYIDVLARSQSDMGQIAAETFALADAVRSRSVQQALAASTARMVVKDPALAGLVRTEQDLGKQINAQLGSLNNALALSAGERDEAVVRAINAAVDTLRAQRAQARQEINRRFPQYAELVDPRAPSIDQIRSTLRPGEVLLSYYFGQRKSFVWAVPHDGAVAFSAVGLTAIEFEAKARRLRAALEPNAETVEEIPDFDLAAAHEIYTAILEPVARAWRSSRSLIVVTNGALGLLPLSLLPTEPSPGIDKTGLPFEGYRRVAWLARSHAVSQVPSVAALRSLRLLPGSAAREPLIGFGDPFFNPEQAQEGNTPAPVEVASAVTTRGIPLRRRAAPKTSEVDSAELAQLPRLPDTADELRSVALALDADPSKALFLGRNASERKLKSIDLSGYRIVAFATHGLVPGELNGLSQPALALSAPEVSDSDGDGLLTMEEILALKLDADWVVLSACNTGSGAGAGAEAASGLGQAFFYAGTRALLVTNWSVHSVSARELVTDLFSRQAKDTAVGRSEALRQAIVSIIDGGVWKQEDGKPLFAYAHPLFWAPYTIIGDGGRN